MFHIKYNKHCATVCDPKLFRLRCCRASPQVFAYHRFVSLFLIGLRRLFLDKPIRPE